MIGTETQQTKKFLAYLIIKLPHSTVPLVEAPKWAHSNLFCSPLVLLESYPGALHWHQLEPDNHNKFRNNMKLAHETIALRTKRELDKLKLTGEKR